MPLPAFRAGHGGKGMGAGCPAPESHPINIAFFMLGFRIIDPDDGQAFGPPSASMIS